MKPLLWLWRDVVLSTVGLLLLVGAVVVLIDGVEAARLLATGAVQSDEWMALVWARLPGQVLAGLPVVGAVAAANVAVWWQRTGRTVSWQLLGRSPQWLAWTAGAAVFTVALLLSGAREVVAPRAAVVLAGQGTWVAFADGGSDLKMIRARGLGDNRFVDADVAWLRDGVIVAKATVQAGYWVGERWDLQGVSLISWDGLERHVRLPSPDLWRQQGVEVGMDASWRALRDAPNSPARGAWIAERWVTPVASGLLACLAVLLVFRFERWGLALALCGALVWRMAHISVVTLCGRAALPGWVGGPGMLALLVLAWVLLRRFSR